MKNYNCLGPGVLLALAILCQPVFAEPALNVAEGTLTVDGQTATLSHAYADEYEGDITVIVADSPIPPAAIPDSTYDLGAEGGFKGFVFSVSRATKELQEGGVYKLVNAIHFYPAWNQLGTVGDGELSIIELGPDILSGHIATRADNELGAHTYSYDASFTVDLTKAAEEFTIVNADDEPSQAFALWAQAVFDGDAAAYKQQASEELLAMMPEDEAEIAAGIAYQRASFPSQVAVMESTVNGNEATLILVGRKGNSDFEGTATMLLQNGSWKVGKQSWSSSAD